MADKERSGFVRLLRLWGLYAYVDWVWVTRDLKSAVLYAASEMVANVAAVTALWLLAERFDGIGPWSKPQILFMLGYATLVRGVLDTLFSYNVMFISRRLGRGQLDHLLVQPQPLWMSLVTEGFTPFSGSANLLPGLILIVLALSRLPAIVSPGWLVLLGIQLIASAVVVLAFSFCWGSLAFWAPRAAEEINSSTSRLLEALKTFPLDGLGWFLQSGMLSIVPVGFLAWYPARSLLGLEPASWRLAVTPLAALLFSALALGCFRLGLRQYGRTGSQRYLSFGHRR
jgi:ABC-2 type transport system permease protein